MVFLFLGALVAVPSFAQQIYKTVDEDGKVSYTSEPPPDGEAETLQTLPEPDQADVDAARQRQRKIEDDLAQQAEARREQAEREARYGYSGGSTIVINTPPALIPGAYYYPRYHRRHPRDRRDRDRYRHIAVPGR